MKLSTRGRYGLRACYYLAENYYEGYTSVSDIAKELSLSENYLEQLIRILKQNDIIASIRGAKGGYRLNKKPSDITVGEILRLLEGDFTTAVCAGDESICDNRQCQARNVFSKIDIAINKAVDSITLEDMLNDED
ncbi:MAG: Rrf2 family transcriptional regulator [Tissierellia bacterium]|nr:Rrf2 family transcriptional regulator [Tissierellia bacterium]